MEVGVVVPSRSHFGTRLEDPGAKPNKDKCLPRLSGLSSRLHPFVRLQPML